MKESLKISLTNWFIIIFVFIILGTAGLGYLFQNPILDHNDFEKYRHLLSKDDLNNTKSIEFQNKMGKFTIHRHQDGWQITSPQTLQIKGKIIEQLLSTLGNMKIAKIFNNELINRSNFLLENPQVTIKLILQGKEKYLRFGIINPIDNSTYLLVDKDDVIFNVNVLDFPLSSISITELIDDRAFPINIEKVTSIVFKRNAKEKWILVLQDGAWIDGKGQEFNSDAVMAFLQQLSSIPSIAILAEVTEKQQKKIDQAINPPIFEIGIKQDQIENNYQISNLINNLPDVKTDKKTTFVIFSSLINSKHLVAKEYLNQIVISPDILKKSTK